MIDVDAGQRDQRPGDQRARRRRRRRSRNARPPRPRARRWRARPADSAREIGALQEAQRPRSTSQLTTGMFCSAVIGALQCGQAERGVLRVEALGAAAGAGGRGRGAVGSGA